MELLINEVIIPVLAIVLMAVATAVAAKIRQKYGLDIEDKVIEQAVHWAEEQARKKAALYGDKIPSNEKLDMAVQFVWEAIPAAKKASYQERLRAKIEAAVNRYLRNG